MRKLVGKHLPWIASALLVGVLTIAGRAEATIDYVYLVTQPIGTESGLFAIDVPVIAEGSLWDGAWYFVEMTTKPIPIQTPWGPQNRNAAAAAGLQIHVLTNDSKDVQQHSGPPGLFGDTLRVELDLTGFHPDSGFGYPLKTLVPATVSCMLANARRASSLFKYLDLRVRGDPRFADVGRVYRLDEIPEPPERRRFKEEP